MAIEERDPLTGHRTTGHEWNGIKELNTPVPRIVYFFLITTTLFGLVYWVFMPALPLGTTYTKGILGYDERNIVRRDLARAAQDQAHWRDVVAQADFATIAADETVMGNVREAGHALFGQNCAVCHGVDASGNAGFPGLSTGALNWGDTPEAIEETIRVGINSAHPESRSAQMPAFGRDGILQRAEIEAVAAYVHDLGRSGADGTAADHPEGAEIFAANCAACHGDDARGNADVGAPDLADDKWLYGGGLQTVYSSVWAGREGHMPTWEGRLGSLNIKILATYLDDLRKARP